MEELLRTTQAYRLLDKECAENTSSHAYLLLFNDARNLRLAAKTFAKLFFRTDSPLENARRSKLIDEESFADCPFLPEPSKKLSVDDAERIKEESLLTSIEGDRKLFVLTDFADANPQTQNKLLKLLEEPPKGVTFLLGATSAFPVLPTVLSRVKRLELPPFSDDEVTACLTRLYPSGHTVSALNACAIACGGIVGEAQGMLEGGYYQSLLDGAFSLLTEPLHRLPTLVRALGETKHKKELLSLLRLITRDALLFSMGKRILLHSEETRVKTVANGYSRAALLYAQEALSKAELEVQFNAVFAQCLETCITKIRNR